MPSASWHELQVERIRVDHATQGNEDPWDTSRSSRVAQRHMNQDVGRSGGRYESCNSIGTCRIIYFRFRRGAFMWAPPLQVSLLTFARPASSPDLPFTRLGPSSSSFYVLDIATPPANSHHQNHHNYKCIKYIALKTMMLSESWYN